MQDRLSDRSLSEQRNDYTWVSVLPNSFMQGMVTAAKHSWLQVLAWRIQDPILLWQFKDKYNTFKVFHCNLCQFLFDIYQQKWVPQIYTFWIIWVSRFLIGGGWISWKLICRELRLLHSLVLSSAILMQANWYWDQALLLSTLTSLCAIDLTQPGKSISLPQSPKRSWRLGCSYLYC